MSISQEVHTLIQGTKPLHNDPDVPARYVNSLASFANAGG